MKTFDTKPIKAIDLLKSNKSVAERADKFVSAIQRNLQRDVLDALTIKKEKIEDELFELTTFNLETNVNAGLRTMTKEECETRFKKIIDLEYELKLTTLELNSKQEIFDKYF